MTGAVYQALIRDLATGQLRVVSQPASVRPGVVLAPLYVGICGTDLQILNGTRPDAALVIGHEASAVVVDVTEPAMRHRVAIGQLVIVNPVMLDPHGRVTGIVGHDRPGMLQQRIVVDAQDAGSVIVPAPKAMAPQLATLVEPLSVCVYAHDIVSRLQAVGTAMVVGAGPIGALMAWLLGQYGTRGMVVVDRDESRLRFLAEWAELPADTRFLPLRSVEDRPAARIPRMNSVFYCADLRRAGSVLATVLPLLRTEGCIDFIARPPPSAAVQVPAVYRAALHARAENVGGTRHDTIACANVHGVATAHVAGHRGAGSDHLRTAVGLALANGTSLTRLITDVIDLHDAVRLLPRIAHEDTARTPDGVRMKTLVRLPEDR